MRRMMPKPKLSTVFNGVLPSSSDARSWKPHRCSISGSDMDGSVTNASPSKKTCWLSETRRALRTVHSHRRAVSMMAGSLAQKLDQPVGAVALATMKR